MICLHLSTKYLKNNTWARRADLLSKKTQGHLRQEMVLFYRLHLLLVHLRQFHGLVRLGFFPKKYMCNLTQSWKFTEISTVLGSLSA